ncbi:hypothetical protein X975_14070, partial [Stegodyphus mimosarum]
IRFQCLNLPLRLETWTLSTNSSEEVFSAELLETVVSTLWLFISNTHTQKKTMLCGC